MYTNTSSLITETFSFPTLNLWVKICHPCVHVWSFDRVAQARHWNPPGHPCAKCCTHFWHSHSHSLQRHTHSPIVDMLGYQSLKKIWNKHNIWVTDEITCLGNMPSPRVVKVPCLHHLNMIMEHGLYIGGIGFGLISRFRWSQGAPNRPSLPLLEGTIPADARLAVTCHRCDGTMHGIGHGIISMYATAWKNHLKKSQPSSMIFNSDLELQEKTFQWLWWLVTSSGYIKLDDRTHVTATNNLNT